MNTYGLGQVEWVVLFNISGAESQKNG